MSSFLSAHPEPLLTFSSSVREGYFYLLFIYYYFFNVSISFRGMFLDSQKLRKELESYCFLVILNLRDLFFVKSPHQECGLLSDFSLFQEACKYCKPLCFLQLRCFSLTFIRFHLWFLT